jgi:hypothetical protein
MHVAAASAAADEWVHKDGSMGKVGTTFYCVSMWRHEESSVQSMHSMVSEAKQFLV